MYLVAYLKELKMECTTAFQYSESVFGTVVQCDMTCESKAWFDFTHIEAMSVGGCINGLYTLISTVHKCMCLYQIHWLVIASIPGHLNYMYANEGNGYNFLIGQSNWIFYALS